MTTRSQKQVQQAFRQGYTAIPLVRELPEDTFTPVEAYLRLTAKPGPSFLLESVEGAERLARYSFLGARPVELVSVRAGRVVSSGPDADPAPRRSDAFRDLGRRLMRFHAPRDPDLPPFCGGAVGYVGYEMFRHLEPSTRLAPADEDEARFMLCADVVAFDRLRHRLLLIANVLAGPGPLAQSYGRAEASLDEMERLLRRPSRPARRPAEAAPAKLEATLGQAAYCAGVRRLKARIRAGDIFQAVLSERFERPTRAQPFAVYRALRAINPSPYMFHMDFGSEAALGASPEMLVRAEQGLLETRPIAGTRPRGQDEAQDARQKKNLLASVKERAEHLMLVDLGRNDLGRVAKPGSVSVPSFMQVERYSHVMHIVSSVQARLKAGLPAWEALASCFPAGTVTGAPKIRAVQLLSELEPAPRGLYAGAVVYCGFNGSLDSAIAIRSLSLRRRPGGWTARVQAGAGIVADSKPEREYQEVRDKAGAMLAALRRAEAA